MRLERAIQKKSRKKKKKHKIRWKNESTNIIIETFQNVLLMNIRLWAFKKLTNMSFNISET